jgi:predicted MPP superfamily phosphohydrolase
VLTHSAEITDKLLVHNPDLILSGNTLGGIINPGFTKPLFLEENTKYYKDYYKLKDTKLYISNGLGTDESNMRFNNLPSITLFRIYKK